MKSKHLETLIIAAIAIASDATAVALLGLSGYNAWGVGAILLPLFLESWTPKGESWPGIAWVFSRKGTGENMKITNERLIEAVRWIRYYGRAYKSSDIDLTTEHKAVAILRKLVEEARQ